MGGVAVRAVRVPRAMFQAQDCTGVWSFLGNPWGVLVAIEADRVRERVGGGTRVSRTVLPPEGVGVAVAACDSVGFVVGVVKNCG